MGKEGLDQLPAAVNLQQGAILFLESRDLRRDVPCDPHGVRPLKLDGLFSTGATWFKHDKANYKSQS